ncbi:MAG: S8 family serine peptidase, partial [Acidimicrobiia bacterium]
MTRRARTILVSVAAVLVAASWIPAPWADAEGDARGEVEVLALLDTNGPEGGGLALVHRTADDPAAAVQVAADLAGDPDVRAVDVGSAVYRAAATPPSNDTYRSSQWALDRLRAEDARAASNGNAVVVALIDSGVKADHPDLSGLLLPGADFIASTDGTGGDGGIDTFGHGTHVAGLLAARVDNLQGVAGLAPGIRILPIRAMDDSGQVSAERLTNALLWAVAHGADVINLSFGGTTPSSVVATTIQSAIDQGIAVVAAAGNEFEAGNPTFYPAAHPGVVGVGATTVSDTRAPFSGVGSWVDLAAPGNDVFSTCAGLLAGPSFDGLYCPLSGTSMSTGYVSALAAMRLSQNPSLTPAQVATALTAAADDLGPAGPDTSFGAGIIDPVGTLTAIPPAGSGPTSDDFSGTTLKPFWTYVNPAGTTPLTLTGTGARLAIPAGTSQDIWDGIANAPRLLQPVGTGDYEIEAKFATSPTTRIQLQGLYLEATPGTWLRFITYHDGTSTWIAANDSTNGTATWRGTTPIATGTTIWLRVTKTGTTYTGRYSRDGTTWTTFATLTFTPTITKLGPYAGTANGGTGTPPALTTTIDHFSNTASPVVPDDGGTPTDGTPPTVTAVGVSPTATGATVTWTTDEPATSVVLHGTTTSLGSTATGAPGTSHTVSLTGLTCATAYRYRVVSADPTGNTATSPTGTGSATFSTSACPPVGTGPTSDDFSGTALEPFWTYVNPAGVPLEHTGTGVRLALPAGTSQDIWDGIANAPRLLQPVGTGDYEIEAKFATSPTTRI